MNKPLLVLVLCLCAPVAAAQEEADTNIDIAELTKDLGISSEMQGELDEAFNYYFNASIRNNGRAQLLLANAYEHGRGTEKDLILSYAWYSAASVLCDDPEISPEFTSWGEMTVDQMDTAVSVGATLIVLLRNLGETNCEEYFP